VNHKTYSSKELQLDVRYDDDATKVAWMGRSTARDPASFIGPVLTEALQRTAETGKEIVLDFRTLEYMNSSTITPVIRFLHEAKRSQARVLVLYARAARWQELSFSALTVFETADKRIEVRGM
jgi:hypothetical protein